MRRWGGWGRARRPARHAARAGVVKRSPQKAAKRSAEKKATHEQNWTLRNGGKLVVATIESSGRWSPDLIDFP